MVLDGFVVEFLERLDHGGAHHEAELAHVLALRIGEDTEVVSHYILGSYN
jgi:hypothetical protein